MNKTTHLKNVAENYPNQAEFHTTADGHVFLESNSAFNHASTLEDKTIATYTRAQIAKLADDSLLGDVGQEMPADVITEDEAADQTNAEAEVIAANEAEATAPKKTATKKATSSKK